MTPDAYRAALARLGLTQAQAGKWLSSGRSGRRWATDGAPKAVGMFLNLVIALLDAGWTMEQVEKLSGPSPPTKPLGG